MYCPECRSEFESWVETCPDCDRPLVAELPPDPGAQELDLRVVLETSDPDVLPIATSALRAAGIPHWTQGEGTMDLWPMGQAGGRVPSNLISAGILVPADRYEEARALLETAAEIVEPPSGQEEDVDPREE
jgi:hypothetical protein